MNKCYISYGFSTKGFMQINTLLICQHTYITYQKKKRSFSNTEKKIPNWSGQPRFDQQTKNQLFKLFYNTNVSTYAILIHISNKLSNTSYKVKQKKLI